MNEEEKQEAKLKWSFIHSIVKNIIINAITTISYSRRLFKESPIIEKAEDIKSENLREIYNIVIDTFNEWEVGTVIKRQREKGVKEGYRLKSEVIQVINIGFTVIANDWIYEDLLKRFYNNIGKSYKKSSNEEYLEFKKATRANSIYSKREARGSGK